MMKKNESNKKYKLWTILIFFCIANSSLVWAKPKGFVRIGDFEVVPNLSIGLEFNTNTFSEADNLDIDGDGVVSTAPTSPDEDEDSDVNYVVKPSVNISYPGENLSMDLGYSLGIVRYFDFDNEDHNEQNLRFKLGLLTPSQKYKFGAGYKFRDTQEVASSDIRSEADNFQAERKASTIFGTMDVLFGKSSTVVFSVSKTDDEYDDRAFESESTEKTSVSVSYTKKFLQKTSAVLRYAFHILEYPDDNVTGIASTGATFSGEKNSDSDNHSISLGLKWDASAKISGEALAGFTTKKFDDDNPSNNPDTANLKIFDDQSEVTIGTKLSYNIRERSSVRLGIKRNLADSAFANAETVTSTAFTLGYKQGIGKKLQSDVFVIFSVSEYEENQLPSTPDAKDRTDDKLTFGLSLNYPIREWIFWEAQYKFEDNSSDIDDREYTNHKVKFTVGTKF